MTNIQERLAAHYAKAREHYGEENILGVFLYGQTAIDEACNNFILSLIRKQLIWLGDI